MVFTFLACTMPSVGTISTEPRPDDVAEDSGAPGGAGGHDTEVEHIEGEALPGAFDLDIEPHGAGFTTPIEVAITATEDVEIWYTLDDSLPVPGVATLYEGPFTVDRSLTVRAAAVAPDGREDHVAAGFAALSPAAAALISELPVVILISDEVVPDSKDDGYVPFRILAFEDEAGTTLETVPTVSTRGAMKVRGSSTAGYPKHSYAFETWEPDRDDDWDVELFGLASESDWVLLAPLEFDRAFMRNAFAYWMSNEMGTWAPHTRFVELFAAGNGEVVGDGDYLGVYVLVERIKQSENRVDIAQLGPVDVEEPEVTGGYVFKRDRLGDGESGFWAGTGGGVWEFDQYLVYVDPDEEDLAAEQKAYLTEAVDSFGYALAASDGLDPVSGLHWSELIDVDSWIDHHIVNAFTMNPDALRLSGYLHKEREGPIFAGPVWDFDRTMACNTDYRCIDPTTWDATHITSDTTALFEHGWYRGLLDHPDFTALYWDRWREVLEGPLTVDVMLAQIDAWELELDEAAVRNFQVWSSYGPDGSYANEVDTLRDWIEARHAWISGCLERDNPEHCSGG